MPEGSSSSQSRFTVLSGPMAGKELVVEQTVENILIGSDSTCRFHLPAPGVSPIHARLWMDASGVMVYDTNSPRGLFVNDDRVKGQAALRNGDILWLGTPGDDDVVMIQCRLPTREAVTAPPIVEEQPATMILPVAAPSDAEETMMLGSSSEEQAEEPAEVQPEETSIESSAEPETIVSGTSFPGVESEEEPEIEAENFEPLGEEAASDDAEPVVESAATVEPEPLDESAPTELPEPEATLPLSAERRAPTPTMSLPDDFMIEETQFFGSPAPTEPPTVPPPAEEPPPAVEEHPVEEPPPPEEEAIKFSLDYEQSAAAPFSTPVPPHTFEDETGHSAFDAEAPTMMAEPKPAPPVEAEPPATELPATVLAPPPPRYEPPPVVPPPQPAATPRPRPQTTKEVRAVRPPEGAPAVLRPRVAAAESSTGRYVVFGAVGLVLLGAIGFFGVRFLRGRGATTATTSTLPETVTPTTMAALPPPTTMPPPPVVTPTPPVEEAVTIVQPPPPTTLPAAPSPTVRPMPPTASPTARATPTPRPAAPATTTPAAPSAEAVRAQQVASLLGQADAAVSARNYDSAAGLYDQALKLDPQNSKASAGKAAALASAGALKKTFVTGRTSVQSGKTVKKTVAGFDSEDVSVGKAPDYSGRIEFEVSPRNVKPGDSYSARVFLSNDGKKAFKISTLNVVTSTNGSESGGQSSPPVKEVQPQQRVSLKEVSGVWQEGTSSWNLEVSVVSDRGDVFKNTVTWR